MDEVQDSEQNFYRGIVDVGEGIFPLQDEILHTVAVLELEEYSVDRGEGQTSFLGFQTCGGIWGEPVTNFWEKQQRWRWICSCGISSLEQWIWRYIYYLRYVEVTIDKYNGKICRIDVEPLPRVLNGGLHQENRA